MNKAFLTGVEIIKKIEKNGEQAFFIGGAVRDFLMGKEIADVDITTSASIFKLKEIFPNIIPVGIDHGTIIVRYKNQSFEISTFRPLDNPHPTLESDVHCRDFTMNAIAMTRTFDLIDYVDGKYALINKEIKAVQYPELRMKEDPLRILRALRFLSSFGFSIEDKTLASMHKYRSLLIGVAEERIRQEWTKILQGPFSYRAMDTLIELHIHDYLPVFKQHPKLMEKNIEYVAGIKHIAVFFAFMHVRKPQIPIQTWVKAWKLSNKEKQMVQYLLKLLTLYEREGISKWFVYCLDPMYDVLFIELHTAIKEKQTADIYPKQLQRIREKLPIHAVQDLRINGQALLHVFPHIRQGPWIASMMEQIQYEIVMNQLENKKDKIKEWILCHPPEIN